MTANLLPSNASPFERAVEQLNAERFPLATSLPREFKDPATCPVHLLPYLAYEYSVDAWRDDWSETKKREVIASAFTLNKQKGTLAGLKLAAKLADAEIIRATVPPSKTFLAPSLTLDERNQFIRRYPELRVYKYRNGGNIGRGVAAWKFFPADGRHFVTVSDAAARYGRQGYLYRDGVETPLSTTVRYTETTAGFAVDYQEIRQRGKSRGAFSGAPATYRFALDNNAAARIFRIRIDTSYTAIVDRVHFNTVKPGLETLGYQSEPSATQGTRRGIYATGSYVGQFFDNSHAGDRLFDRLWLFDPAIPVEPRGRSTHLGGARLGMPAHTSEIVLRMRGKRPLFMAGRFMFGQLTASDQRGYRDMLMSVRAAKSARDRVLVNTSTYQPVTAGLTVTAGDKLAGSFVEII